MQKIKYGKEGRFVEGTSNFRIDSLKQHDTINSHTEAYKRFRAEKMRETSSTVFFLYTGEVETDDAKYTRDCQLSGVGANDRMPWVVGPLVLSLI